MSVANAPSFLSLLEKCLFRNLRTKMHSRASPLQDVNRAITEKTRKRCSRQRPLGFNASHLANNW